MDAEGVPPGHQYFPEAANRVAVVGGLGLLDLVALEDAAGLAAGCVAHGAGREQPHSVEAAVKVHHGSAEGVEPLLQSGRTRVVVDSLPQTRPVSVAAALFARRRKAFFAFFVIFSISSLDLSLRHQAPT